MESKYDHRPKGIILKSAVILLAFLVTLLGISLLFLTWVDYTNPKWLVEKTAQSLTNRNVKIKGNLNIYIFSLNPGIKAERITLKSSKNFAKAKEVEARLDLSALLRGTVIFTKFWLINGLVNISEFKTSRTTVLGSLRLIRSAEIRDVNINYTTHKGRINNFHISDFSINYAEKKGQSIFQGNMESQSLPIHLHGVVQVEQSKTYPLWHPFKIYAYMERIDAALVGRISENNNARSLLIVSAKDPSYTLATFGLTPGPLPPFKFAANLVYKKNALAFKNFKFLLGKTYAHGNFSFRRGKIPFISMDIIFNPLRYKDIKNLLLKTEDQSTAALKASSKNHTKRRAIFNNQALPFNLLNKFNINFKIHVKKYQSPKSDLFKAGILKADLKEGHLQLISAAKIAEGTITASVDTIAAKVPHFNATAKISKVEITDLVQKITSRISSEKPWLEKTGGQLDGFAKLKSEGQSLQEIADHLTGRVKLLIQEGYAGNLTHVNARLALVKNHPHHILTTFKLNPGSLPSFKLTTNLNYQHHAFTLKDCKLLLGRTHAYGKFSFQMGNIPFISTDIVFDPLRRKDIEDALEIKNRLTGTSQISKKKWDKNKIFDTPLPFNLLHKFEGYFKIHVKEYRSPKPDSLFKAGTIKANLKEGHLQLISAAKIAKGTITASVDTIAAKVPHFNATAKISKVEIAYLTQRLIRHVPIEKLQPKKIIGGKLYGFIKLKSQGRSPHKIASHLEGKVKLAMENGYISSLVMQAMSLHVPEAIVSWLNENPSIDINCMLVSSTIDQGKITTPTFLISSNEANIIGSGTLNLRKGTLWYSFKSFPKNLLLTGASLPIMVIKGSFQNLKPMVTVKYTMLTTISVFLSPLTSVIEDILADISANKICENLFNEIKMIRKKSAPSYNPQIH